VNLEHLEHPGLLVRPVVLEVQEQAVLMDLVTDIKLF
jgi:hypothetical protein